MAETHRTGSESTVNTRAAEMRQLVCFNLGGNNFGVDISRVHEINRIAGVTHVPDAPFYVEGLINLRGDVIPIVNLRKRFKMTEKDGNIENRIVVIEVPDAIIGLLVDSVTEVLRISESQIEPPPKLLSTGVELHYIEGVAKVGEDLLIVLNTDLIFSEDEFNTIKALS
ncbi:MAG: purine-binding chemotaxis protein CheW [FCB group bacterium]|nr:purine-binding chemotaxis protein CheW [FCB group bacterium]